MENERCSTNWFVPAAGIILLALTAAVMLLPIIGRSGPRCGKNTLAGSMISNFACALAEYKKDFGVYPPMYVDDEMDKPNEALYYFFAGAAVSSPKAEINEKLTNERANAKVYLDFKKKDLDDCDGDGYYEIVDPWGNPYMYVSRAGQPETADHRLGKQTRTGCRPFHNRITYDLYSMGLNGRTGTNWIKTKDMLKCSVRDPNSIYRQAADEFEDGQDNDDISNF